MENGIDIDSIHGYSSTYPGRSDNKQTSMARQRENGSLTIYKSMNPTWARGKSISLGHQDKMMQYCTTYTKLIIACSLRRKLQFNRVIC